MRHRPGLTGHILACAYKGFGCSNGHISVGLIFVILGVIALGGIVTAARSKQPPTSQPPGSSVRYTQGRWEGGQYTAKVTAVTPSGVKVNQARCCRGGHSTPDKAVAHAAAIKRRIERLGR